MRKPRGILLMLDFDGTLSPIASTPDEAFLPDRVRAWLSTLARRKGLKVAVVSGRSLRDIRTRIKIKGLIYAANHGMEIAAGRKLLLSRGRRYRKPLRILAKEMRAALNVIPGAIVEEKGLSVAVHYRMVRKGLRRRVRGIVEDIARRSIRMRDLQLTGGKMVMEVRPSGYWNKGDAVAWIWRHLAPRFIPVYIGDDVTDEDAFAVLRGRGLTIRIGKKAGSMAECAVPSLDGIIRSRLFSGERRSRK